MINATQTTFPGEHLVAHLRLDNGEGPLNVCTWLPDADDGATGEPAVVTLSTHVGEALTVSDARTLAAALSLAAEVAAPVLVGGGATARTGDDLDGPLDLDNGLPPLTVGTWRPADDLPEFAGDPALVTLTGEVGELLNVAAARRLAAALHSAATAAERVAA